MRNECGEWAEQRDTGMSVLEKGALTLVEVFLLLLGGVTGWTTLFDAKMRDKKGGVDCICLRQN